MKDVIFTRQTIDVMKKTVQIVTIPLNKEGWSKDELLKHIIKDNTQYSQVGDYKLINGGNSLNAKCWQAQQLLVLSDDEIQEGDTFLDSFGKIDTYLEGEFQPASSSRKIIASYPQLSTTLPISKETVQAWIDAGTPGEGSVEMIQKKPVGCSILNCEGMRTESCDCFDEKWKIPKLDPQGNLLLEFGEKDEDYYDEDIYDAVIDFRKKHPEKVSVVKPSIPTDEEIKKKAAKNSSSYRAKAAAIISYTEGYKQALKDLGHE
jgi:hypothetical protein